MRDQNEGANVRLSSLGAIAWASCCLLAACAGRGETASSAESASLSSSGREEPSDSITLHRGVSEGDSFVVHYVWEAEESVFRSASHGRLTAQLTITRASPEGIATEMGVVVGDEWDVHVMGESEALSTGTAFVCPVSADLDVMDASPRWEVPPAPEWEPVVCAALPGYAQLIAALPFTENGAYWHMTREPTRRSVGESWTWERDGYTARFSLAPETAATRFEVGVEGENGEALSTYRFLLEDAGPPRRTEFERFTADEMDGVGRWTLELRPAD